jgi:hypothetical protein
VLLYHDFASFAVRSFHELNPRTRFAANWHIELIAAKLAAVRPGLYQQAPSPQGGGMVKAAWFRRYAEGERPDEFRPRRAELGHRQQGLRAQRF